MTNYERIKNMSVEEIADLIDEITDCCVTNECSSCPLHPHGAQFCHKDHFKIWLESEVEEE